MNAIAALFVAVAWVPVQDPKPQEAAPIARLGDGAAGHRGEIRSLVFSPSGDRLASASEDGTVRVWDVVSGTELFRLEGSQAGMTSVAFSADGRRVAGAGEDRTARLWDASTGRELRAFEGNKAGLSAVRFVPGSRVATASFDGRA